MPVPDVLYRSREALGEGAAAGEAGGACGHGVLLLVAGFLFDAVGSVGLLR